MNGVSSVMAIVAINTLTALSSVRASDQKVWLYPCDVYMSVSCIRLPNGMSVSYEVPADSGIYTVKSSGKDLASVYIGSAPRLPSGVPSLKLTSADAKLTGFLGQRDGEHTLDIVIIPERKGIATTHFFASFADSQRSDVVTVASSLRACRKPSKEALWCPSESEWGAKIAEWLNTKLP